uniref:DNA helicase Pif1-like 2B domain-containing protein n=2 Tax=Nicotiana TaxID=4085 RepID=A0A1S3Y965_TOBAC
MEKIQLTRNMRARTDPAFSDFLLRVGNGEEHTIKDDLVLLLEQLVIKSNGNISGEDRLISEIYPSLNENGSCAKYMTERTILASRNEYIDQLNEMLIVNFSGESKTFISFDSAEDDTNNYYQEEYLNTLTPNDLPPHGLILKKNIHIMLLRNLDPSNGLCNGTRM